MFRTSPLPAKTRSGKVSGHQPVRGFASEPTDRVSGYPPTLPPPASFLLHERSIAGMRPVITRTFAVQ